MHEYTPEAAQAIESPQREFNHRLMVDWGNNGRYNHPLSDMSRWATRTTRDQALTSTAPEELMLIEGYAAASLDVELAGEYQGLSLVGHFAPYNGRSVFYSQGLSLGVRMYYEIAVWTDNGWEWYRQFTGIVREVELNREQGTVTLHCLDNAERMRTPVSIPPYAMYKDYLVNGYKRSMLVDSSSLIDMAARSAGFSSGPQGWDTAHKTQWQPSNQTWGVKKALEVPFHGSHLPTIGFFDNEFEFHLTEDWEKDENLKWRAEQFRDGPWGNLALNAVPRTLNNHARKLYWCDFSEFYWDDDPWGTTYLGTWIYWTGVNHDETSDVILLQWQNRAYRLIVQSNGGVYGRLTADGRPGQFDSPSMFLPNEPGWYFVGAAFADDGPNGTTRIRTLLGSNRSDIVDSGWALGGVAESGRSGLVTVQNKYALSDLCILRSLWGFSLDIPYQTARYNNANISWGRNRVTYTLRDESTESWELAKEVAAAEYGVTFFSEDGKFNFWNYADVLKLQQKSVKSLSIDDVSGLDLRLTMDSVRNFWKITSKTGFSSPGIIYDFSRSDVPYVRSGKDSRLANFTVPANGQYHQFWLQDNEYVMSAHPDMFRSVENLAWNDHWPRFDYKPYSYINGQNVYQNVNLPIVVRKSDRNWTELKIGNPGPNTVGFVGPNDQPWFRVGGTVVTEDPERTWTYSTDDVAREATAIGEPVGTYGESIRRYGQRVIELGGNRWLQDEFQTRQMLREVMKRYGRPTPVTDAISVPGDPRIQIGDCIDITDPDGLGGLTRLQILGISREIEDGVGLRDTYQVEVIEVPGIGRWDDDQYGRWDQSLIWS
ncbi:hypothetical protein LZ318_11965 [Saccharopolyspora indica]|uniref:hypothetical protein n=1 Tax=Saccharopolyspora indica TaxID=1229659 RepID=UPI0022EABFA7|nr:hypothetical protein [Saccharopolyspora indica]MDA3643776.1 hypothetical protein [Saccharopolyspora indica]